MKVPHLINKVTKVLREWLVLTCESVVAVARLKNGVVWIELGRFCTARMHVVVEPCCSTSNNSATSLSNEIKCSAYHLLIVIYSLTSL
jgi:hypothetical protein